MTGSYSALSRSRESYRFTQDLVRDEHSSIRGFSMTLPIRGKGKEKEGRKAPRLNASLQRALTRISEYDREIVQNILTNDMVWLIFAPKIIRRLRYCLSIHGTVHVAGKSRGFALVQQTTSALCHPSHNRRFGVRPCVRNGSRLRNHTSQVAEVEVQSLQTFDASVTAASKSWRPCIGRRAPKDTNTQGPLRVRE